MRIATRRWNLRTRWSRSGCRFVRHFGTSVDRTVLGTAAVFQGVAILELVLDEHGVGVYIPPTYLETFGVRLRHGKDITTWASTVVWMVWIASTSGHFGA